MSTERFISSLLLDGGVLCLNFANTIHDRSAAEPFDYLHHYQDLLDWYKHADALPGAAIRTLAKLAKAYPPRAQAVFEKAVTVRELLYRLFAAQAAGQQPDAALLTAFNQYLAQAFANLQLEYNNRKHPATLSFTMPELDVVWWAVVKSAEEVLTTPQLQLVRQCPACHWLFIDKSKNRSRKWCNMATCGDLNKVRQFHERKKQSNA